MSVIKKVILFIKNIFIKQDEVKKLEEPKIDTKHDNEDNFKKSLKITNTEKKTKKRIETLICDGDGLGIQNNITY